MVENCSTISVFSVPTDGSATDIMVWSDEEAIQQRQQTRITGGGSSYLFLGRKHEQKHSRRRGCCRGSRQRFRGP